MFDELLTRIRKLCQKCGNIIAHRDTASVNVTVVVRMGPRRSRSRVPHIYFKVNRDAQTQNNIPQGRWEQGTLKYDPQLETTNISCL
jgi:hypothetical protein